MLKALHPIAERLEKRGGVKPAEVAFNRRLPWREPVRGVRAEVPVAAPEVVGGRMAPDPTCDARHVIPPPSGRSVVEVQVVDVQSAHRVYADKGSVAATSPHLRQCDSIELSGKDVFDDEPESARVRGARRGVPKAPERAAELAWRRSEPMWGMAPQRAS